MKLIVFLSIIAFSNGEKLDKIYLPPNAQASGGSNEILQTPIVVVENKDFQRQIAETVEREEVTQRTIVNNVVEYQRPIVTNNAAFQRPVGFAVNRKNQGDEDVVRIGNRGNFFVQNQNPEEYKEVQYQGPRYQAERTQAALERNAAIIRQEYKNEGDAYAYAYETENGIRAEENGVATNGVNAKGAFSYVGDDGVQYSMSYTADENGFQPQGDHIPRIPEEILRSLEQNARDEAAGIFDDGSYDVRKYGGADAGSYDVRKYGGDDAGSYDERKYGGNDADYQQRVSIVTSRPNIPTLIQSYTSPPTYIQPRPTVPTITQNYPTVPTIIDHRASNDEAISNSLYSKYRLPGYRYPSTLVNQKNNLSPVVNALIQEVTPSSTQQVYLPPVKRKVISENRPTKLKRKTVIVKRKPAYKKNGDNNKS